MDEKNRVSEILRVIFYLCGSKGSKVDLKYRLYNGSWKKFWGSFCEILAVVIKDENKIL